MNIFPANSANIKKAADIIRSGGIVAFPTETVYGLGAGAFNPKAVSKIFEAKKRPFFDPLIVHIASITDIDEIAEKFGSTEKLLAQRFWPGPLTLVLPKRSIVPDIVTSGLPTVAVRMPANEVAASLIREACTPIAAPSANLFGRVSPTKAEHVFNQLGANVDMILDGGPCTVGVESTIIKIEKGQSVLLRPGGIPVEEIEKITGMTKQNLTASGSSGSAIVESPGQMPFHYSPVTPLIIVEDVAGIKTKKSKAGILVFRRPKTDLHFAKMEILSESGDLREAAANLFSSLNNLDAAGLDIIYAERVPSTGLGMAIMDRLTKAAKRI